MKDKKALAVIDGMELTERDFMSSIDNELVHLHDTGDINRATQLIVSLDALDNVSGHAKAKFLYGFNEWWQQNKPDDVFSDHIESTTGTKPVTTRRYIQAQKFIENYTIPKEIAQRPMREIVPIASTLAQGFDISKDQWRKINLSTSSAEIGAILRDVKGKQPRKSARVIKLTRDGSLFGYKDNKKYFIGFLNINEAEKDEVLAEFIEKIKIGAGVLEE